MKNKKTNYSFRFQKKAKKKNNSRSPCPKNLSYEKCQKLFEDYHTYQSTLENQKGKLLKIQRQLEESSKKYVSLFDLSPIGYFTSDKKGIIIEANITIANFLGVNRRDLTNNYFFEYVSSEDKDRYNLFSRKVFKSKKTTACEIKLKRADGKELYVLLDSIANVKSKGTAMCFTATTDITLRKQLEEKIKKYHAELESLIKKRTAELQEKNNMLAGLNTTLNVLLKKNKSDREALEQNMVSNTNEAVLPFIEKLKKTSLNTKQEEYVSMLESNLKNIVSPLSRKLSSEYLGLTPSEIMTANLVKEGKSTKTIAELLNVSCRTIETYRDNIRNKFGLKHKKANLRSYLLHLQ